jgi:hydrophobe/amphiphile efflux-1 (HAE1) family protein
MTLSEICIKRPVLTVMMSLALVLFGLVALDRLPVRELPDIDPPLVNVTTVFPGANAEVVETEVTERLEEAINGVDGIKEITSESREELSSITVEFTLARSIDVAAQDVRDRVARVRGALPDDVEDPIVAKQDSDARPMMWIALFSERYTTQQLTEIGDQYLKDGLQTVEGVSSIIFGGEKRFAIRVRLDSRLMAAHGVAVNDVGVALREQNVELPSGRVESETRELIIETKGELKSADDFAKLIVRQVDETLVRLGDIAVIEDGVEDERSIARYRSKPSVGLGIVKQAKANTIAVATGVKEELERRLPNLPAGVEVFVAYDESTFVDNAIEQVWISLFLAFILVVATIYLFLASWRSTIIPALTIPVSTIATFAVLWAFGFSVNILTMLGLVLAIGIVVDDSIVVLENIYRHIEDGKSAVEASLLGMKEITFAVIATTVALLAVFLPLSFQTTITGRLFVEFAIALCGAVIVSTFIALTLTPMACSRLLKKEEEVKFAGGLLRRVDSGLQALSKRYGETLLWSLDSRKAMVAVMLLCGLGCGVLYSLLDKEFLPEEDKGRLFCLAIAPEGATSEYTDKIVAKMEQIVASVPEVAGYFSAIALARGGPGRANEGLMFVRFKENRSRSVRDIVDGPQGIQARYFGEVEGAFGIAILPKAIGGGFAQNFQLVLQDTNLERLNDVAQAVAGELRGSGMLQNVRTTFELNKPQLDLHIDRDRAAAIGISIEEISRTLQILFGGRDLSTITRGGEEYDVVVQLDRQSRMTPEKLKSLYLRNDSGDLIQLSSLLRSKIVAGPNKIEHFMRQRSATIEGTPGGLPLGTIVDKTEEILKASLPAGMQYRWKGEADDLKESSKDSFFVLLFALAIIYMVLAAQFESFIHPLTVMLTLPLGAFGAFAGLYALSWVNQLGQGLYGWANYSPDPPAIAGLLSSIVPRIPSMSINLFSLIGMLLLFGLVTKNAILLVDFANRERGTGASARKAIERACQIRLRPILMTALATISGILPIAIGFGAGAESRRAMGVAIVFGMLFSTFLTLYVVPVAYTLFADLRRGMQTDQGEDDVE